MLCVLFCLSCVLCPVTLCPVSCVLCPVSCILYPVSCVLCPVSCVLCPVSCVLCPVSCVLCLLSVRIQVDPSSQVKLENCAGSVRSYQESGYRDYFLSLVSVSRRYTPSVYCILQRVSILMYSVY